MEENINPPIAPIEKKEDPTAVVKKNNIPIRIGDDPYDERVMRIY